MLLKLKIALRVKPKKCQFLYIWRSANNNNSKYRQLKKFGLIFILKKIVIFFFLYLYLYFYIYIFQVSIPFRRQARICIGRQPFKTIEKNILSQLISYDDVTCIFNCDVTYNKVKFCGLEIHLKKISKTLEENVMKKCSRGRKN